MATLRRYQKRLGRLLTHSVLSYYLYRYRYLAFFIMIGFVSVLVELIVVHLLSDGLPWLLKAGAGFGIGLGLSFSLNSALNFHVPRSRLLSTFYRFAAVSLLSFALNMLAVSMIRDWAGIDYSVTRLFTSGTLFLLAYTLHRQFTFDMARDFGVAVYAAPGENVSKIFTRLGRNCDHIHVDLVDETYKAGALVDLNKVRTVRRFWPGTPVCLHLMSRTPSRWLASTWDAADWFLFHLSSDDDLMALIVQARLRKKKVGIVWHVDDPLSALFPYLPHVDLVGVLGVKRPGFSGQVLEDGAVAAAEVLDGLRNRYGFEIVFDGGVSPATIHRIPAKYVVSASAVLGAPHPPRVANVLRTAGRFERPAPKEPALVGSGDRR